MKVIVVDDSALVRSILIHLFESSGEGITVVDQVSNGEKAIESVKKNHPDLVVMDINMPVMNGMEATRRIMSESPVPILVFSNEVDAHVSFQAMEYGAVDILKKPEIDRFNNPEFYKQFIQRILQLGKIQVEKKLFKEPAAQTPVESGDGIPNITPYSAIVLGASTGGPTAVQHLLMKLPANFPVGIALVQHLEEGFVEGYVKWLDADSPLTIRVASDKDFPKPGEVIVAPSHYHLKVIGGSFCLDNGEKVLFQKPSVDVLFSSAAQYFRNKVLGVLLTGMGSDGAQGCVDIVKHLGFTVVQDEHTSVIFGMPKAAIDRGGASQIAALDQIPSILLKKVGYTKTFL